MEWTRVPPCSVAKNWFRPLVGHRARPVARGTMPAPRRPPPATTAPVRLGPGPSPGHCFRLYGQGTGSLGSSEKSGRTAPFRLPRGAAARADLRHYSLAWRNGSRNPTQKRRHTGFGRCMWWSALCRSVGCYGPADYGSPRPGSNPGASTTLEPQGAAAQYGRAWRPGGPGSRPGLGSSRVRRPSSGDDSSASRPCGNATCAGPAGATPATRRAVL